METHQIPPHGEVNLISFMGGDLTVVNAARVSFGAHSEKIEERDKGLIKYLMANKHASPFEHSVFQFHIKCPIFVAREWMRHRWSSFNEFSMRYAVPDKLEFWVPENEDWRKQVGKPGAYSFERIESSTLKGVSKDMMLRIYEAAEKTYKELLEFGIAKEIARAVLPVSTYTQFYWTVNARSLINFLSLRNSEDAQLEIAYFADAVEFVFAEKMPVTYNCFIAADRAAI